MCPPFWNPSCATDCNSVLYDISDDLRSIPTEAYRTQDSEAESCRQSAQIWTYITPIGFDPYSFSFNWTIRTTLKIAVIFMMQNMRNFNFNSGLPNASKWIKTFLNSWPVGPRALDSIVEAGCVWMFGFSQGVWDLSLHYSSSLEKILAGWYKKFHDVKMYCGFS